jgi:fucose permease
MCSGITDTATASLVAVSSNGSEQRSQNLALIQSTRAGARIITPVFSGYLFEWSNVAAFGRAMGALPYLTGVANVLLMCC